MFPLKDNLECKTFPYVTVALILLNCLVTIWQTTMQAYTGSEAFHGPFWLIPSELIQSFGSGDGLAVVRETFTLFSYQFLHGGLMHLVGNMFFLYVVGLTSGVFLWQVAQNTGTIDNIERFFESFGWQTFELHGGEIYHNAWVAGLFLVVGFTGFAVLMATLFNLITDLVGGIRISVLEEEVVSRDERGTNPARAAVLSRLERFGGSDRSDRNGAGGGGKAGGLTNPFRRRG